MNILNSGRESSSRNSRESSKESSEENSKENNKENSKESLIRAFIFDLDGVLTDTAEYHYQAWKQIADEYGLFFDRSANERLKGVSRLHSLEIILEINQAGQRFNEQEKEQITCVKNRIYQNLLKNITAKDILPGIEEFLKEARNREILLAVASASRNADTVLDRLGIKPLFDYIADAGKITRTKPDPEVFLDCCRNLGVQPHSCIGFEDSQAGIEAIRSAQMRSVGIHVTVTSVAPDLQYQGTEGLDVQQVLDYFEAAVQGESAALASEVSDY